MYITATFPYIVTTIFLVRSIMLDGADAGIKYMFTPDVSMHTDCAIRATRDFFAFPTDRRQTRLGPIRGVSIGEIKDLRGWPKTGLFRAVPGCPPRELFRLAAG